MYMSTRTNGRILLLLAITIGPSFAAPSFTTISSDNLKKSLSSATSVDVRYPADFRRGHIKGAVSIPFYSLKTITYPKDQALVVYCSGIGCSLSDDAAITLQELGYTNVKVLTGGIAEWSMKGYPMEGDPNAAPTFKTPYFYPQWAVFTRIEVTPKELSAKLNAGGKFYLIDTRPAKEYAAGHLPAAHNSDWRDKIVFDSILPFCVLTIIAVLIIWPSKRAEYERGRTPLHQERCNGFQRYFMFLYGGTIYNWRISLYDDFFVVASLRRTRFLYENISSVECKRHLISTGITIHALNPKMDFTIFPRKEDLILSIFKRKGITISSANATKGKS